MTETNTCDVEHSIAKMPTPEYDIVPDKPPVQVFHTGPDSAVIFVTTRYDVSLGPYKPEIPKGVEIANQSFDIKFEIPAEKLLYEEDDHGYEIIDSESVDYIASNVNGHLRKLGCPEPWKVDEQHFFEDYRDITDDYDVIHRFPTIESLRTIDDSSYLLKLGKRQHNLLTVPVFYDEEDDNVDADVDDDESKAKYLDELCKIRLGKRKVLEQTEMPSEKKAKHNE